MLPITMHAIGLPKKYSCHVIMWPLSISDLNPVEFSKTIRQRSEKDLCRQRKEAVAD